MSDALARTIALLQGYQGNVDKEFRALREAAMQTPNRRYRNNGQGPMDALLNPDAQQNNALLQASLAMLQADPRKVSPMAAVMGGAKAGMGSLIEGRKGDIAQQVTERELGLKQALGQRDMAVKMAGMVGRSKPTAAIQEYQYAVDQGYKGSFQEFQQAKKGPLVNVNTGQGQFGPIPAGHQLIQGEDGTARMEAIPGSPAAREVAQAETEAKSRADSKATIAGYTLRDAASIQKLIPKMHSNGEMRWMRARVSGTPEFEVQADIKSLQGTIGIEQLLRIKESGAGLGQVPQSQLDLLSRLMGELDIRRDPERLQSLIGDIQGTYMDILEGMGEEDRENIGIAKREFDELKSLWGEDAGDIDALIKKYTGG